MADDDETFMRIVVAAARRAAGGDGPFNGIAALVARDGEILSQGLNEVHLENDPTRHAEIVAIGHATRAAGTTDLSGATLYSSLQPCEMCLAALRFAGIARVVFAATKPRVAAKYFMFGGLGISDFRAASAEPFEIRGGLLEAEVLDLYAEGDE